MSRSDDAVERVGAQVAPESRQQAFLQDSRTERIELARIEQRETRVRVVAGGELMIETRTVVVCINPLALCSELTKKKVRLRTTGPPRLPPNWFWRKGGMGAPGESKKFLASKTSLRTNSNRLP